MDNKRVYKKISTIFWFLMATLPLWVSLFGFIGQYISGYPDLFNIPDNDNSWLGYFHNFSDYFVSYTDSSIFQYMSLGFIYDMFVDLFDGILELEGAYYLVVFCSWFVSVYFYELMLDFIVWLPRWFHNIMEKGFEKVS